MHQTMPYDGMYNDDFNLTSIVEGIVRDALIIRHAHSGERLLISCSGNNETADQNQWNRLIVCMYVHMYIYMYGNLLP
jgi:hypothetical protein